MLTTMSADARVVCSAIRQAMNQLLLTELIDSTGADLWPVRLTAAGGNGKCRAMMTRRRCRGQGIHAVRAVDFG